MSLMPVRIVAVLATLFSSSLWAQTFELLYAFPKDRSDGRRPTASLTAGPGGYLYGTTTEGGTHDAGTVFRVSTGGQVEILNDFEENTTGRLPYGRLLNIGDGSLYGVSERNGNVAGNPSGTVYRLDEQGGLTALFQFPSGGNSPRKPRALTSGEANTLHVACFDPAGLWRVPLDGAAPSVARLFGSTVTDGIFITSLIRGSDGLFYGTTQAGGAKSLGTIFRIAPDGTGLTQLYSGDNATGVKPAGAMVQARDGNFYGTMEDGGPHNGCIFRLTPDGNYKVIHFFNDLRYPEGDLLLATDGQLYGTATEGGVNGLGGVFRIRTDGSGYKVLHTFKNAEKEGRAPVGGVVQGSDGNLYGTTLRGGPVNPDGTGSNGTIFRIKLKLPPPPVNRPPAAINDLAVSTGAPVEVNVRLNDYDPDGDALTVTLKTQPLVGSAAVQSDGRILYTPGAGYDGADFFTYTVTDGRGGSDSAMVRIVDTPVPAPIVPGFYNGLLALDSGSALPKAQFWLAVEPGGAFSGVLFSERKRIPLRGALDQNGTVALKLNIPGKGAATLFLSLQAGEPATVAGVFFGEELWSGVAGRAKEADAQSEGNYTVILKSNPDVPAGHGFGIMRIQANGTVVAAGRLGDGSPFSWASLLVALPGQATVLPVFSEPTAGGVCAGFLLPEETPGRDFGGPVRWVRLEVTKPSRKPKPYEDGFDGSVEVSVARYVAPSAAPLDLTEGSVKCTNKGGQVLANGAFTLSGKKVGTSTPLRALVFQAKTGLFAGKMQINGKAVTFQGVINQALQEGAGQFGIGGVTGGVELSGAEAQ